MVKVRYSEGVAIHTDPESCADAREGIGEALTGGRVTPRPQVDGGSRATCGRFVRVDSLGPSRSGRRASIFRFRLVGRAD
jgi:hypothetical protein